MIRFAALLLAPTLIPAASQPICEYPSHPGSSQQAHLEQGEEGWFQFHPHLNAALALGGSTSEKNFSLIPGSHTPIDDGFNLQGIELGAVMEFGDMLSVHANHNVFWDRFDGWDSEWEDAYAALDLPGGIVLRGGQFFAPFGQENTYHLHERPFVEPPISMIRLLGEEGLILQGAELALPLPGLEESWVFRFGCGRSREHGHGATRELRREAFEEASEEPTEGEEEHEEHGHGFAGNGGVYDAEEAYLDKGVFFGRIEHRLGMSGIDRVGLSFATGDNGFERNTWVSGADLQGGTQFGGRPVEWQGELFHRSVEARDAAGMNGDYTELGAYLASSLEFVKDWTVGCRLEWASGNRLSGNERRWRASTHLGRAFHLADNSNIHTRLQYSYDRLGGYADEHSVWLQFVLNFGTAEHGHDH